MTSSYILSPSAQESLIGIKAYSLENFGARQTKIYLTTIRNRFEALADNPNLGIARPDIKEGYYSALVGSHAIYYKVSADQLAIIDILHQKMDPNIHLHMEE